MFWDFTTNKDKQQPFN